MEKENSIKYEVLSVGPLATNCVLVKKGKRALLFDPGFESLYIFSLIRDQNLTIDRIFLTHAHLDHCDHAALLFQLLEDEKRIRHRQLHMHSLEEILYQDMELQAGFLNLEQSGHWEGLQFLDGYKSMLWPDDMEKESVFLGDQNTTGAQSVQSDMIILHTPGHSPGSLSYYFPEAGFVLVGDVLFRGSVGRTDLWMGSQEQLYSSIKEKLFQLPEKTVVISGHGPQTTIGDESKGNPFVGSSGRI